MPASRSAFARLFSFTTVLASLLVLFVFFLLIGRPLLADPDVWWHLRNADVLLTTHAFIQQDTFTFTVAGKPWINPEWLSELPYHFAWIHLGYRGLDLVAIATIEALVLGVAFLAWQRTRNSKGALLAAAVFLPFLSVSFGPRTLIFGWLCLIAELAIFEAYRKGTDRMWLLPVLFAIWINLHGSWPIGMVLFAVFLASGFVPSSIGSIEAKRWSPAQRNKLLAVFAVTVLALFLNPYGARLVAYPFHITFGHELTTNTVEEWQTLDFHVLRGKLIYTIIAALLILSMARRRTWLLEDLLFTLIAVLAAFTYTRLLILAGIVICPLLAREFTFFGPPITKASSTDKPVLNFALIAAVSAVILTHIPTQSELEQQVSQAYPKRAANFLRTADLRGPILNEFGWGGYLEWSLPQTAFFIDTRADVFDQFGVLQEYVDATGIKRPIEVIDKYAIRYVLFPKKDPIVYMLAQTPGWTTIYQDDSAIILARTVPR